MNPFFILFSVIIAAVAYRAINLLRNYVIARKLHLPIIIVPVCWQDTWWLLLGPQFSFLKNLPFGLGNWFSYSLIGWALHDRYKTHEQLGPAFIVVSPAKNEIFVSDPVACEELLSKWKVWTKNPDLYKLFEVFGKNVNSVNGDDWQRHRKITSYGFKESNNKLVWEHSLQQARGMSRAWLARGESTMTDVSNDSGIVAMHVLTAAGFGKSYEFDAGVQEPDPGHTMSYGSALSTILQNLMATILSEGLKAPSFLLPKAMQKLKVATKEFKLYMEEKVEEERKLIDHGEDDRQNLGTALVRANEKEKAEGAHDGNGIRRGVLTDSELYGNLFIFMLAGHETTANTLSYATALLAIHPVVQNWAQEEIDAVLSDSSEEDYNTVFPKLVRCMAIMVRLVVYDSLDPI
jgi:cytochrome P450